MLEENSLILVKMKKRIDKIRKTSEKMGFAFGGYINDKGPTYTILDISGDKDKELLSILLDKNIIAISLISKSSQTDGLSMSMIGMACTHDKTVYSKVKKILGVKMAKELVNLNSQTIIANPVIH